ncbi:DUF6509 family protein [Neobacillus sp. SM06]|uniref:DUF6509 family protein n=1 Tax=Neobacillus sp. SM06 TaxID=3422492 RepID=UPI003D2CCFAA
MNITGHTVEKLEDPFGLLAGERFEYFLDIEVDEDDELYSADGIGLKVIFVIDQNETKLSHYHFYEKETEKVLDFALEDEEEQYVRDYCLQHKDEAELKEN